MQESIWEDVEYALGLNIPIHVLTKVDRVVPS